jgi:transglutaminase-like putative cysteine protease
MSVKPVLANRQFLVKHVTQYHYSQPIQLSKHSVHLRPIHDIHQEVSDYRLTITPDAPVIEYEDVFGNWATRFEVTQPYRDLIIAAECVVELKNVDPFAFANLPMRRSVRIRQPADAAFVPAGVDALGIQDAVALSHAGRIARDPVA